MSTTTTGAAEETPRKGFFENSRLVRMTRWVFHDTGLDRFAYRYAAILFILLALYNPTRYCYVTWMFPDGSGPPVDWIGNHLLEIAFGILFIWSLGYLVRAAHKSLGRSGLMLATASILAFVGLIAWNVHMTLSGNLLIFVAQGVIAMVLTIGLLGASVNRFFSGQVTTNPAGAVDHHSIDGGHHS